MVDVLLQPAEEIKARFVGANYRWEDYRYFYFPCSVSTEILFFISQLVGALAKCSPISKIEISSNFLIPLKYHSPIKLHFVSIFAT
jgi:hypothetical protein